MECNFRAFTWRQVKQEVIERMLGKGAPNVTAADVQRHFDSMDGLVCIDHLVCHKILEELANEGYCTRVRTDEYP